MLAGAAGKLEHSVSAQQGGAVEPQAVPAVPQEHQRASVQKPSVLLTKSWQQPVEHSALLVQDLRQPAQSATDAEVTHRPVQHWADSVQLAACLAHGVAQTEAGEQIGCPVSALSKQQPEAQSVLVAQIF
jgi:hypothetical protein